MKKALLIALLSLSAAASDLSAQIRIVRREVLDSISNPALAKNASCLKFDKVMIQADPMQEDDAPETFIYSFRNTSDSPINIDRIVSTCTCAKAECDKDTVGPGQEASVSLTYYPKGHPGTFERKVFVYTDGYKSPSAILRLKVNVSSGNDLSGLYSIQMGKIRLRSGQVSFSPEHRAVERLAFLNVSDAPLKLQCDSSFLPPCLEFRTEPQVVAPGEEGEIVISFDPEKYAEGNRRKQMQVILQSMGVPPSQSTIKVTVENN